MKKLFSLLITLVMLLQPASAYSSPALAPAATRRAYTLADATIRYVDADATGANNGTSWADAYTHLQAALAAAVPGDQIWVAAGTYTPADDSDRSRYFQLKNGVAVSGGFDPTLGDTAWEDRDWVNNLTILSGDIGTVGEAADNSYHVFYHSGALDSSAILDGFTITAGNANGTSPHNSGGGMYNISSSPILNNVTFSANTADTGGGMYSVNSSPTLTDVIFSGNVAIYNGGGMSNVFNSSPALTNVAFSANAAGWGGGMFNLQDSSPILTNVTFSGNTASWGGGIYNQTNSNPILTNAILWGNSLYQIYNYNDPPQVPSNPEVTYSDIQDGYAGTGNINLDPLFVDAASGNLRLQGSSPVIDAGNNAAVPSGITTDLDGAARFVDIPSIMDTGSGTPPVVDMGAYERQPPGILYVDADASGANNGSTWEAAYTGLQVALAAASTGDQIWVAEGTYTPAEIVDRLATFQLKDGVALYGGFDPTLGDTAWEDRDWVNNPTILSGDLDRNGQLDDSNAYHVVTGSGISAAAILDGFTIAGGKANVISTGSNYFGGGMVNFSSSPSLANLIFSGNNADFGGGMANVMNCTPTLTNVFFSGNTANNSGGGLANDSSSPTLVNVTFSGNTANQGGGIYNYNKSSPTLTNVIFSGNTANNSGGGLANDSSSPTLVNVTFSGNTANQGGGIYNYNKSSPTLTNAILWGSTPDQIYNYSDSLIGSSVPLVTYSDIELEGGDVYTGTGNINRDPLFLRPPSPGDDGTWGTPDDDYGDLRLQLASPAIDAGSNAALPAGITTDLAGAPRFVDIPTTPDTGAGDPPLVDLGAYEAQPLPLYLPLIFNQ